jgi:hypothetical protein
MTATTGSLSVDAELYRALNPKHFEDGLPGDNHFVMSRKHAPGDGVSTGIADLISISQLRSLEVIQTYGPACGIAVLNVGEVLAPVAMLGISAVQQDAPDWGEFAGAHAVITGYQVLSGNVGKRTISDFQRHLVRLARKRFYPANSTSLTTVLPSN